MKKAKRASKIRKVKLCDSYELEYNPLIDLMSRRGPNVALFYPAPYRVAAQSLGFQLLYALLIAHGLHVERFTLDSCGRSLEKGTPLHKFDLILASASFELDYPYLASYLVKYNKKGVTTIAGGLSVTANPIPLLDSVDAVVLGDAEPFIPKLGDALLSGDLEYLFALNSVVTREKCGKKEISELGPALAKEFLPLSVEPPWGKGFLIEVTRGCKWFCRFCLEGWVNKPFRERNLEIIKETLRHIDKPFEKIITISLNLGDYHKVKDYLEELAKIREEKGIVSSVPSLRIDTLDEDTIELISMIGQRTLTVAPETLIPEKATFLGKGFTLDSLKNVVEIANKYKLKLKVYMMLLPGEREELANEDARRLREVVGKEAHVSVNPLIPKPWTPLQSVPIPKNVPFKPFLELFRHVDTYPEEWARLQAALSLAKVPLSKNLTMKKPNEMLIELNEKGLINLKELESWRLGYDEPWLNNKVGDKELIRSLGLESYEVWRSVL